MNKKTFTLAMLFLILTFGWLGANIYWAWMRQNCVFDLIIAFLLAVAAVGMVCNEFSKKKRRHLAEVNKHQIP